MVEFGIGGVGFWYVAYLSRTDHAPVCIFLEYSGVHSFAVVILSISLMSD